MRMGWVYIALTSLALANCAMTEEERRRYEAERRATEAAIMAEHDAEDDDLCRLAGFRPGTDNYRFCRHERTQERGISRQAARIKQSL